MKRTRLLLAIRQMKKEESDRIGIFIKEADPILNLLKHANAKNQRFF